MSESRGWALVGAWGAIILIATSIPGGTLPAAPLVPGLDKLVHLGLYGVLGALVARAMAGRIGRSWVVAATVVAGFAAVDEWHQRWIPGRGADALDWVADVAGATLGASLSRAALVRRETRT